MKKPDPAKNPWVWFLSMLAGYIFFLLHIPDSGHDMGVWRNWAIYIAQNGLGSAYLNSDIDHHPVFLYLLKLLTLLYNDPETITQNIHKIKALILPFDLATVGLLLWLLKKHRLPLYLSLFVILNPAFWYNTVIWGQTDTVYTFFAVGAVLAAYYHRPLLSVAALMLALNTKMQAIIFVPPVLLLLLPQFRNNRAVILKSLLLTVGIQLLIFSPFILAGNLGISLKVLSKASVDRYPFIVRSACNVWYLILDYNPWRLPDSRTFALLSFKHWGLIMFGLASLLALFPLIKKIWRQWLTKSAYPVTTLPELFLMLGLIAIAFYYFNTQMCERYTHPAILLWGIYVLLHVRWLALMLYGLLSVAYLLNLERIQQIMIYFDDELFGFSMNYDSFWFDPRFIAGLFLICFIGGTFVLYRESWRTKVENEGHG